VAPARAVLDAVEISQAHGTAHLAVMQDVALLAFFVELTHSQNGLLSVSNWTSCGLF